MVKRPIEISCLLRMLILLGTVLPIFVSAAPGYRVNKSTPAPKAAIRIDPHLDEMQHELENHEVELRMFEERLNTQETIIDNLRQQLMENTFANKELLKGNTIGIEKKVASVETGVAVMSQDLRDLQAHANDTAKVIGQYKQKIGQMETQLVQLQQMVDTILSALQIEPSQKTGSRGVHDVKRGESLEKIALKYQTTISRIKELNNLNNDRIFIGQKLKVP